MSRTTGRTLPNMGKLSPDDSRPPYQLVTEALRTAIDRGDYEPGAKLPSYEAASVEYGVSVGTVKRAFAVLQEEGLTVTRPGLGSYVRTQRSEPADDASSLAEVNAKLAALTRRVESLERLVAVKP